MLARTSQLLALLTLTLMLTEYTQAAENAHPTPTDTFYIRHGRSKVRHSNEKEHLLWELQHGNNLTRDKAHESQRGTAPEVLGSGTELENLGSGRVLLSSSIPSGNGHLFGSEYWQNSDANGTVINQRAVAQLEQRPAAVPTPTTAGGLMQITTPLAPVTHKIRKLHKKKMVESIRQSADKSFGMRSYKNHRSLAQAEQLQGRLPMDDVLGNDDESQHVGEEGPLALMREAAVTGSVAGHDLDEVLQLADELDLDNAFGLQRDEGSSESNNKDSSDSDNGDENETQENREEEIAAYPNDEYVTTAATPLSAPSRAMRRLAYVATFPTALETAANVEAQLDEDEHEHVADVGTAQTHFKLHDSLDTTSTLPTMPTTAAHKHGKLSYYAKANDVLELTSRLNKNQTASVASGSGKQAALELVHSNAVELNGAQNELQNYEQSMSELDEHDDVSEQEEQQYNRTMSHNVYNLETAAAVSETPFNEITLSDEYWPETHSLGPSQSASTSVGGIGLDRQQSNDLEEINFEDVGLELTPDGTPMDEGLVENRHANGFPVSGGDSSNVLASAAEEEDAYETNPFLAGVIDATNEDEFSDWDEISRSNRRNLMRGRDVVTKFLQIVETQHSLGSNCEAGTSLNLGEGVVDRYAQDRFRVEAEVAVNRANMLTRIFKMTARAVQADVNLLHASVLSMVEFDDDIFAAGNCFDWNEHPAQQGLFCPFAYRLPPPNLGAILAKDLATEYHYLGNTSEWFFQARKNAEKVIAHNEQYLKAFHLYTNKTDERIEDDTLAVKYEDGRWSKPYYDCGGGNIWMLTYTVPFFGYENGTYHFKGTSGIDIDLRRVDIDQCPQRNTPGMTQPLNIFAGTDKCKQRTTMCDPLKGLGFRRGSYKCVCRKGYYFPDTLSMQKFFNGSLLEEEYEKLMLGKNSTYNIINEYECLQCAEGCDYCEDASPCIAALNWPMRMSILVLACTVIGLLPPAAWFTFRYQQVKVVRAASPALLRVIALGAFFIYCTNIVMYPNPNLYTCTARIWLREIGFSLTYGALMLKTWRISVIFRVRSAKAVKITDAALLKRLGIICGVIGTCLLVRTLVSPPDVVVGRTADDLKAFLCKTDWWDYTFTSMEVLFLAWGVRLCIMVRKAPSEFNESRFISMAIYNEFLLTCFLNVSMLFLQSPANPDLLYIIFFCHTQLTVTLLLGLIFGSKVYIVLRSGKSHQESIGLGAKSSGAKFNFRPQVRTFANPSSATTSTVPMAGTTSAETKLSDQEALEEIRQLSMQLQRIQEMAPPKGVAVMTISSLLDGLKTPSGLMMVAAAATQAAQAGNQLIVRPPQHQQGALPLLALNAEMQKYSQQLQLQVPQSNNVGSGKQNTASTPTEVALKSSSSVTRLERVEIAVNTDVSGEQFRSEGFGPADAHVICSQCLEVTREHYYTCRTHSPPNACQQLGSPQPEGSISFSNIKLDCMCSQPDELYQSTARRRAQVRSAATNTPPPQSAGERRRSRKQAAGSDCAAYQICDSCKKKYCSSSRKKNSSKRKSSRSGRRAAAMNATTVAALPASGISQARSHDLLDRRLAGLEVAAAAARQHSTDDIIFYSTTDDSSRSCHNSSSSESDSDSQRHGAAPARSRRSHSPCDLRLQTSASVNVLQQDAPSTSTASIALSSTAVALTSATAAAEVAATTTQSLGNICPSSSCDNASADVSGAATGSNNKANGAGRSKRPDKLVLDLNDRSKYTKEVSV